MWRSWVRVVTLRGSGDAYILVWYSIVTVRVWGAERERGRAERAVCGESGEQSVE